MTAFDYIRAARTIAGFEHDHSARAVVITLATYCDDHGDAWPHAETLAADTGLDVGNVRKALYRLRAAGLTWTRTRRGNVYHLAGLVVDPDRALVTARQRAVESSDRAPARGVSARHRAVKARASARSIEVPRSANEVGRARDEPAVVDYWPPPDPDDAYALAARPIPAGANPPPIVAQLDDLEVMRLAPKLHLDPLLAARLARFEAKAAEVRHTVTPIAHPDLER